MNSSQWQILKKYALRGVLTLGLLFTQAVLALFVIRWCRRQPYNDVIITPVEVICVCAFLILYAAVVSIPILSVAGIALAVQKLRGRKEKAVDADGKGKTEAAKTSVSEHEAYNLFTDTVTGPNIRLKDNVIQGIAVATCFILGAGIGAVAAEERLAGALIGALIGLVVGVLASGAFLAVYRGIRHIRGRHD